MMNKESESQAIGQAEAILASNKFLPIEVSTTSALIMANHLNEYVVPNLDFFDYSLDQEETYRDLAMTIDLAISLPDGGAQRPTTIVVSRHQVEALRDLTGNSSGDRSLKRFEFHDAMHDIQTAYFSEFKKVSDSKISQFLGKLKGK